MNLPTITNVMLDLKSYILSLDDYQRGVPQNIKNQKIKYLGENASECLK